MTEITEMQRTIRALQGETTQKTISEEIGKRQKERGNRMRMFYRISNSNSQSHKAELPQTILLPAERFDSVWGESSYVRNTDEYTWMSRYRLRR